MKATPLAVVYDKLIIEVEEAQAEAARELVEGRFMALLSVGPKNMGEDEQAIGNGYKLGWQLLAFIPFGMVALGLDLRWIVAGSTAIIIFHLHEAGGRLYDLCIRLRRTNLLLNERLKAERSSGSAT